MKVVWPEWDGEASSVESGDAVEVRVGSCWLLFSSGPNLDPKSESYAEGSEGNESCDVDPNEPSAAEEPSAVLKLRVELRVNPGTIESKACGL